jgi:hypothetical protein
MKTDYRGDVVKELPIPLDAGWMTWFQGRKKKDALLQENY